MRSVFLILIIIFSGRAFSQDASFDEVDNYVEQLRLGKDIALDDLASALTRPFESPVLKTRAVYYWLAKNITYDYQGYKTHFWDKYPSGNALMMDTYKFRRGVCSGYSLLFKYMLNKVQIECEVVDGYARVDLETIMANEPSHAWNVVKLADRWHLIDVTWASATATEKVDDYWFNTPAKIFIFSHYPENVKWTLLNEKVTLAQFKNYPVYSRSFLDMGIVKSLSTQGNLRTTNNQISIDLRTTREYVWLIKLYDLEKGEWFSPTSIDDKAFEEGYIRLLVDRKGKFILKLDALESGDGSFTIHNDLIYFIVESR